jgi:MFS family permease
MDNTKSDKAFGGGGAASWATLTVCTLLMILNFMDRQVLAAVLQPMKVDLGLTDAQAGMFATVLAVGAAVFAWPVGMLVDRWSRKKSIGLMAILWSAATFATALGKNFIGVLIPRSLVGIGEAGYGAGSTALLTAGFPAKMKSRIQSILLLGIPVGTILGAALGGYLSAKFGGWQTPFYVFAIPGIILGIIAFFLKDYKTVQATDTASGMGFLRTTGRLFKVPTLVWIYLGGGFLNTITLAFLTWTPAFMMRAMKIGEDKAGLLMALIAVAAFIGTLLGGWIADMWYRKNVKSRLHIGTLAGLLGLVTYVPGIFLMGAGQLTASLFCFFLFGMFISMYSPSIQVATQEVVHPATKGASYGMYAVFVFLFSAPGPVMVGAISDALGGGVQGLQYALLVPSVLVLLSILFFWLGSRTYISDLEKVKAIQLESEK